MISFLGTNPYLECIYVKDKEFVAKPSRFIQTAIFEMLEHEGEEIDKVYLFLTKEAQEKNFEDYYNEERKQQYIGLKNVWNEHFPEYAERLIPVSMKSGQLEHEQWELFTQIYQLIDEGDELYFDITHSFRSNPVIALIISNFARTMKNAKINRLLYGNFEALGYAKEVAERDVTDRIAPIVDITTMVELLDWTVAVDSFLRTGNPVQISQLAHEKVRMNSEDPDYRSINALTLQLSELSNTLEACRGQHYEKEVEKTFKRLQQIENIDETKLPQFSKLVDKIYDKIKAFSNDEKENMWGSIIWCYNHGLYQQCLTLIREHVITIIAKEIGVDIFDGEKREAISAIITNTLMKKLQPEMLKHNRNMIEPVQHIMQEHPELSVYTKITTFRNDMNHAGMRKEVVGHRKIKQIIGDSLEEIKPFFISE